MGNNSMYSRIIKKLNETSTGSSTYRSYLDFQDYKPGVYLKDAVDKFFQIKKMEGNLFINKLENFFDNDKYWAENPVEKERMFEMISYIFEEKEKFDAETEDARKPFFEQCLSRMIEASWGIHLQVRNGDKLRVENKWPGADLSDEEIDAIRDHYYGRMLGTNDSDDSEVYSAEVQKCIANIDKKTGEELRERLVSSVAGRYVIWYKPDNVAQRKRYNANVEDVVASFYAGMYANLKNEWIEELTKKAKAFIEKNAKSHAKKIDEKEFEEINKNFENYLGVRFKFEDNEIVLKSVNVPVKIKAIINRCAKKALMLTFDNTENVEEILGASKFFSSRASKENISFSKLVEMFIESSGKYVKEEFDIEKINEQGEIEKSTVSVEMSPANTWNFFIERFKEEIEKYAGYIADKFVSNQDLREDANKEASKLIDPFIDGILKKENIGIGEVLAILENAKEPAYNNMSNDIPPESAKKRRVFIGLLKHMFKELPSQVLYINKEKMKAEEFEKSVSKLGNYINVFADSLTEEGNEEAFRNSFNDIKRISNRNSFETSRAIQLTNDSNVGKTPWISSSGNRKDNAIGNLALARQLLEAGDEAADIIEKEIEGTEKQNEVKKMISESKEQHEVIISTINNMLKTIENPMEIKNKLFNIKSFSMFFTKVYAGFIAAKDDSNFRSNLKSVPREIISNAFDKYCESRKIEEELQKKWKDKSVNEIKEIVKETVKEIVSEYPYGTKSDKDQKPVLLLVIGALVRHTDICSMIKEVVSNRRRRRPSFANITASIATEVEKAIKNENNDFEMLKAVFEDSPMSFQNIFSDADNETVLFSALDLEYKRLNEQIQSSIKVESVTIKNIRARMNEGLLKNSIAAAVASIALSLGVGAEAGTTDNAGWISDEGVEALSSSSKTYHVDIKEEMLYSKEGSTGLDKDEFNTISLFLVAIAAIQGVLDGDITMFEEEVLDAANEKIEAALDLVE